MRKLILLFLLLSVLLTACAVEQEDYRCFEVVRISRHHKHGYVVEGAEGEAGRILDAVLVGDRVCGPNYSGWYNVVD